jgi:GNAT superfamily N-acetyltransferase
MVSRGATVRAGEVEHPVDAAAEHAARGANRYPFDLVHEIAWDGDLTLLVRPIRPDDAARLKEFHHRLSTRSTYLRFFNVHPELSPREVEHFTCVDYQSRLALVVECDGGLVAVGRYERLAGSSEAEVAFVVADAFQHHGIGTLLLDELAAAAWARGITVFVATTLAENRSMLDVFRHSGFHVTSRWDHGAIMLRLSISPDHREAHHEGPRSANRSA